MTIDSTQVVPELIEVMDSSRFTVMCQNISVIRVLTRRFLYVLIALVSISGSLNATGITGTGGARLDIFSGQKPPSAPTDTLYFQLASQAVTIPNSTIPDRFRLYDLDLDGSITEWETNEVVKDFKENDSPFDETEVYSFIDYFFTVSEPVIEPPTY